MSGNTPQDETAATLSQMRITSDETTGTVQGEDSGYSHQATIAAISSFYEIVNMAHVQGQLKYPPSGGWPSLHPDRYSPLIRHDRATELKRHMPYFFDITEDDFFIMDSTTHFNYASHSAEHAEALAPPSETDLWKPDDGEDDSSQNPEEMPPHIVYFAQGEARYGFDIYIDTERGAVICCRRDGERPGEGEKPDLKPLDNPGSEESLARDKKYRAMGERDPLEWRRSPTYRVETFFNMCTKKFLDCEWMALVEGTEVWTHGETRQQIMKDCGWPNEGWDKERAVREIEARIEEVGYVD